MNVATDWNPIQKQMKAALARKDGAGEAVRLCLELHGIVHTSPPGAAPSLMDDLWDGLSRDMFGTPPAEKNSFGRKATVAWNIWHITRIEDLIGNILMADGAQVFDGGWRQRMDAAVADTGNAMSDEAIAAFSRRLRPDAMREYRDAVGARTREILGNLTQQDIKRKVKPEGLARILREGGVTEDGQSKWLLDYWGGKDMGGLMMMPFTRHQIVHLNECMRLKK